MVQDSRNRVQAASRQRRFKRWPAKSLARFLIPEAGFTASLSNDATIRKQITAKKPQVVDFQWLIDFCLHTLSQVVRLHATGTSSVFCVVFTLIYTCVRKNLTTVRLCLVLGMPDPRKQEYYQKNRESRISYQRDYYQKNKHVISRKREVREFLDPEEREAMKQYNREYYARNRDRIKERRKAKRIQESGLK